MKKTKTTKRKVGRPKLSKGKTCRISITIPNQILDKVIDRAKRLDMSVSAYIRYVVQTDTDQLVNYYFD